MKAYRSHDEAQLLRDLPPEARPAAACAMDLARAGLGDATISALVGKMPAVSRRRLAPPSVAPARPAVAPLDLARAIADLSAARASARRSLDAALGRSGPEASHDMLLAGAAIEGVDIALGHALMLADRAGVPTGLSQRAEGELRRQLARAGLDLDLAAVRAEQHTQPGGSVKPKTLNPMTDVTVLCMKCATLNAEDAVRCTRCGETLKAQRGK